MAPACEIKATRHDYAHRRTRTDTFGIVTEYGVIERPDLERVRSFFAQFE